MTDTLQDRTPELFARSIINSFSDMAFLDVVAAEPVALNTGQVFHILFTGPESGDIVLHLPNACKKQIVENIYGENWGALDPSQIDDCLLEILNVLAGCFLKERFGEDVAYDISLPELLFDESILATDDYDDYFFDAEGNAFKASIRLSH